MKPDAQIGLDEWLKALEQAQQSGGASAVGLTTLELAAAWGTSKNLTLQRLKTLVAKGLARCAGRKRIDRIDGVPTSVPVYAVVKRVPAARTNVPKKRT